MRLVVVGAGITGAACAYAAAGLGAEVILADAGLPGQATAAGAGIICPWSPRERDPVWYRYGCAAERSYPGLIDELAQAGHGDVSYRRTGALMLAGSTEQAGRDAAALVAARADGATEIGEVQVLAPQQAVEAFPPLKEGTHAVLVSGAARVDGRLLAAALIRAAVRRGAVLRPGPAELTLAAGRVTGVRTADETVGADAVVAAAGVWTGSFVRPAGAVVRVSPQRGQIAHISVAPAGTSHWPVVLPGQSGHYLLAFDDSRVVAGATRETGSGFDPRVTAAGVREVMDEALAVAPGLAAGTHLETRAGLRPVSADGLPLLGLVPGVAGLVVATGLGASGLTLGPLTGTIAARLALGLDPGADIAAFSPVR
ncbi:MAG: NAD(P)/FAD-dependent oxidoreductase [Streptosporangiaceae bacterium]